MAGGELTLVAHCDELCEGLVRYAFFNRNYGAELVPSCGGPDNK
jgi:hypothetical protein